jgi:hypothetical protein
MCTPLPAPPPGGRCQGSRCQNAQGPARTLFPQAPPHPTPPHPTPPHPHPTPHLGVGAREVDVKNVAAAAVGGVVGPRDEGAPQEGVGLVDADEDAYGGLRGCVGGCAEGGELAGAARRAAGFVGLEHSAGQPPPNPSAGAAPLTAALRQRQHALQAGDLLGDARGARLQGHRLRLDVGRVEVAVCDAGVEVHLAGGGEGFEGGGGVGNSLSEPFRACWPPGSGEGSGTWSAATPYCAFAAPP